MKNTTPPTEETKLQALVTSWNKTYQAMEGLTELWPAAYEAEVAHSLLHISEEEQTWDLALAIFNHPNCEGGWYAGDVKAYIEKQIEEEKTSNLVQECDVCGFDAVRVAGDSGLSPNDFPCNGKGCPNLQTRGLDEKNPS